MERDKQKKLEKERKDKEQFEALKAQESAERDAEAVLKENAEEKRSDNEKESFPSKSRFVSNFLNSVHILIKSLNSEMIHLFSSLQLK